MTIHGNTKEIKLNKFFTGVNDSVINTLFKLNYFKDVKEGEIIYRSGDSADCLYILLRGDVKIKFHSLHYMSNKIFNDFFGEKELIEKTRRISTAVANSKCLLYLIDEKIFDALLSKSEVIKNNINIYGEVDLPEAGSVSNSGMKLTDTTKPISFRATSSSKNEQSNIVTEEFGNNSESISDTISEIIEQENLESLTEFRIEQPSIFEEQEQSVEELPMEQIDIQVVLGCLNYRA